MKFSWNGFLIVAAVSATVLHTGECFTRATEETLRTRVLKDYNAYVRPSQVTKISMLFHVTSIAFVDIRNEVFSVSGWWSMHWDDDRLVWNDYPNIPVMQFSENRIWTPVIVVSNSIENLSAIEEDSIPLRVARDGKVSWSPPGLLRVSCSMDVTYFPFDRQTCSIEITSFGYTIQEMDVKIYSDGLSFRYYSKSGEWDIEDTYSERTEFNEDGYSYARVTFFFDIRRKPLYYGLNMLLPVIICSALSLFVFLLPPESGEKIGYCLTVLLAFMVILTLVAQDLPTTASNTPILQVYIAIVLIMGGLSVVLSIFVLHLFFLPEDKPVGPLTEKVTKFFMLVCCQDGCCKRRVQPQGSFKSKETEKDIAEADSTATHKRPVLIKEKTFSGLRPVSADHRSHDQDRDVTMTWQTVSRTLDGVLFRFYALFMLVSSVAFVAILVTS